MPIWFKLCLAALFGSFWIIPISVSIPFIYYDRYLITFILAFLFIYLYFCLFLITQYHLTEPKRNDFYRSMTVGKLVFLLLSVFGISLLVADTLRFLTPVTADFIASEFAIHEYKVIRVEPYAKAFRQLSKLYVVDIKNNETSFVLKTEMLNQLGLSGDDRLIVKGRSCIAGFVIDNINGFTRD